MHIFTYFLCIFSICHRCANCHFRYSYIHTNSMLEMPLQVEAQWICSCVSCYTPLKHLHLETGFQLVCGDFLRKTGNL